MASEETRQAKVLKTLAPTEHETPALPPKKGPGPVSVPLAVGLALAGFACGVVAGGLAVGLPRTPAANGAAP